MPTTSGRSGMMATLPSAAPKPEDIFAQITGAAAPAMEPESTSTPDKAPTPISAAPARRGAGKGPVAPAGSLLANILESDGGRKKVQKVALNTRLFPEYAEALEKSVDALKAKGKVVFKEDLINLLVAHGLGLEIHDELKHLL